MKKLSFLFIIIIAALILLKESKPKELWYDTLVYFHILKPCYNPMKDFTEVFKQEGVNYEKEDKIIVENSIKKIANLEQSPDLLSIPYISHHIYFVTRNNTKPLLPFYIKKMEANFNKLNNSGISWQHFLWTNDPNIFPEHIKNMKGVVVRNLNELHEHPLHQYLIDVINKGNENKAYFMEASDIMRLMALQKFGGIYTDMDYEIYNAEALLRLIRKFDFIIAREFYDKNSYYGNAVLIAKPNHPIINEALTRMKNYSIEKNLPKYLKYPCNFYDRLYFNSPPLITFAFFSKNNIEGNNDVVLPAWMLLNAGFAKYKNGDCDYAKINREGFDVNNQNLQKLIFDYTEQNSRNAFSKFDIIGADMFCATWVDKKAKRNYYWNFK